MEWNKLLGKEVENNQERPLGMVCKGLTEDMPMDTNYGQAKIYVADPT